uniref:Embryo surrounding region 6 n=1 Tax=Zea mays TaxID=4577 RepID=A0A0F6UUK9_MAIZE|nr:embryo surrounding region 6 [Zea mays]AKE78873.1 embryo surrounding region 6 [Zea mays]
MPSYRKLVIVGFALTLLLVSFGMDASAKLCSTTMDLLICGGAIPGAVNQACDDTCRNKGYTGGGFCNMKIQRCVCRKPCALEEQTEARAGDEAAGGAGDMMSRTMAD